LADLERLLTDTRLLSLTSPGGCGKTRLAMQFANTVSGSYKDGVWLAELAPLRDPTFVPLLLTKILDIPHRPEQSALESLLDHLQSKEILLVLDNCEHLIVGCAQLVGQILSQTAERKVCAKSSDFAGAIPALDLLKNRCEGTRFYALAWFSRPRSFSCRWAISPFKRYSFIVRTPPLCQRYYIHVRTLVQT
jgi:hypothetical protein